MVIYYQNMPLQNLTVFCLLIVLLVSLSLFCYFIWLQWRFIFFQYFHTFLHDIIIVKDISINKFIFLCFCWCTAYCDQITRAVKSFSWWMTIFMISLGKEHVGYRRMDFPVLKLSVVGGRPFSCGGKQLFRKRLLSARFMLTWNQRYFPIWAHLYS